MDSIRDGMSIGITINSYDGKDSIDLAMDVETLDDSQIIYNFEREPESIWLFEKDDS